jgi:hypothetical protein
VFCGKCCVRIDKIMFIVVKIKCVNSGRICDIYDKVNFTTKLHILQHPDIHLSKHTQHFIRIHTNIINFDTFGGTVPLRDLKISLFIYPFLFEWIEFITQTNIKTVKIYYMFKY